MAEKDVLRSVEECVSIPENDTDMLDAEYARKSKLKLNARQKKFADRYLVHTHAGKAAREAGYADSSADRVAHENLNKPSIREYLKRRMRSHVSADIADQEEVLSYLTAVMRGKTSGGALKGIGRGEEIVIDHMPPTVAEQIKAAELMGKRYGAFSDKVNVAVAAVTIVDDLGE